MRLSFGKTFKQWGLKGLYSEIHKLILSLPLTGDDIQHHCVMLAACQAQSSQSASLFLDSWLSPPFVHSLSVSSFSFSSKTAPLNQTYIWMMGVAGYFLFPI